MGKSNFEKSSLLLFCALLLSFCACDQSEKPPNILMILADTQRQDSIGIYGHDRNTTPNLDKFFKDGVRFDNAVSSSQSTAPSMASLFTGRRPMWHPSLEQKNINEMGFGRFFPDELKGNKEQIKATIPPMLTIAKHLSENGWFTAGFIANSWLWKRTGLAEGFDYYEENKDYFKTCTPNLKCQPFPTAQQVLNRTIDFVNVHIKKSMKEKNKERFFLYVHLMDPHYPYTPDVFSNDFFKDISSPKNTSLLYESWQKGDQWEFYRENSKFMKARYDECVLSMDFQLGGFLEKIKKKGMLKNTIVIFLADHGEEFMEHGQTVHRNIGYVELNKTPLLFRFPGSSKKGKVIKKLFRGIDIFPTLSALCGVPIPDELPGKNMAPVIFGDGPAPKTAYFAHSRFDGVIHDKWKLMRIYKSRFPAEDPIRYELYDISNDSSETVNLAGAMQEKVQELEKILDEQIAQIQNISKVIAPDKRMSQPSKELIDQLKAVGYLQ